MLVALEYVIKDLQKKRKAFLMRVLTIFLTVTLVSFICELMTLYLLPALLSAVETLGDYDFIITRNAGKLAYIGGNTNFYNDENEMWESGFSREEQ